MQFWTRNIMCEVINYADLGLLQIIISIYDKWYYATYIFSKQLVKQTVRNISDKLMGAIDNNYGTVCIGNGHVDTRSRYKRYVSRWQIPLE